MAIWKKPLLFVLFALISAPTLAQQSQQEAERQVRAVELEQRVVEVQMREAEERLAQAARKIAELSSTNLPGLIEIERRIHMDGRAVLGITIASEDDDGPVEGVEVRGVSPGGAAADAGLRSGDIITAVNDESLTADNSGSMSSPCALALPMLLALVLRSLAVAGSQPAIPCGDLPAVGKPRHQIRSHDARACPQHPSQLV